MAFRRGSSRFVRSRRGTEGAVSEEEPSAADLPDGLLVEASPAGPVSNRGSRVDADEAQERFEPLGPGFDRVSETCPAASTFRAAGEAVIPG